MISARRWLLAAFLPLILGSSLLRAQTTTPVVPAATPAATIDPPGTATTGVPSAVSPAPPAATPRPPQTTWSSVHVNGQFIAMTFDDGPSAQLTPRLLDILKERGMHVTFFVVGQNAKDHPEILKRAVAEGHEIANHSWSHPNLAKMSDEAVRSELNRTSEAIAAALGKTPNLMRPPYGSLSNAQRKWVHDDLHMKIILWDVDPLDWKRPGPSVVEQRILDGTRPGSIILSHDIHAPTIEAMPDTFDKLLAKGYKFVTVDDLLAMETVPEVKPVDPATAKIKKQPKAGATPKPSPNGLPDKINGSAEALR